MEYKIVPKREHVIITDMQGNFICSCDTHKEAKDEIKEMKKMEQKR